MSKASAAAHLREQVASSNALHHRYLDDPEQLDKYAYFIRVQLGYFLPQYDDLRDRRGYSGAIDFVVSDLTGPGIADRDRELEKVVPVMTKFLPGRALTALALAMELNARILTINLGIADALDDALESRAPISERDYCLATRAVTDLAEFRELIGMTREAGESLARIVRVPMIRSLLRSMRLPARMAGVSDLQAFLEKGFDRFVAVEDVDEFLHTVEARMGDIFTRVFERPVAQLSQMPITLSAADGGSR